MYKRFDPEGPAPAPWRADRPHSPAQRIIDSLDMPFGDPRILLTGTVGTGKTTELLRVAEVRANRERVVYLVLARHFNELVRDSAALDRVSSWEVCFLAGVALIGTLKSQLQYEFLPEDIEGLRQAWSAVATATETPSAQLDIGALARSMTSALAPVASTLIAIRRGTARA